MSFRTSSSLADPSQVDDVWKERKEAEGAVRAYLGDLPSMSLVFVENVQSM